MITFVDRGPIELSGEPGGDRFTSVKRKNDFCLTRCANPLAKPSLVFLYG
jgi:hypothetical protein